MKQPAPNETDNTIRLDILLWYSKILKEIKFIDSVKAISQKCNKIK